MTCVSWNDAQRYVSWLSLRTGAAYRLPSEAEWELAAAGSRPGCYRARTGNRGTCPVGLYGSNEAGLSDMVGNVEEWTSSGCPEGACIIRGGAWTGDGEYLRPSVRVSNSYTPRLNSNGFRVARTLVSP